MEKQARSIFGLRLAYSHTGLIEIVLRIFWQKSKITMEGCFCEQTQNGRSHGGGSFIPDACIQTTFQRP